MKRKKSKEKNQSNQKLTRLIDFIDLSVEFRLILMGSFCRDLFNCSFDELIRRMRDACLMISLSIFFADGVGRTANDSIRPMSFRLNIFVGFSRACD